MPKVINYRVWTSKHVTDDFRNGVLAGLAGCAHTHGLDASFDSKGNLRDLINYYNNPRLNNALILKNLLSIEPIDISSVAIKLVDNYVKPNNNGSDLVILKGETLGCTPGAVNTLGACLKDSLSYPYKSAIVISAYFNNVILRGWCEGYYENLNSDKCNELGVDYDLFAALISFYYGQQSFGFSGDCKNSRPCSLKNPWYDKYQSLEMIDKAKLVEETICFPICKSDHVLKEICYENL